MARAKVGSKNFIAAVETCLCLGGANEKWLAFGQL
jgi:hypothetical protein